MSRDIQGGLVEILSRRPVIPVITLENIRHAVPIARALVAGGLHVIEITLRSAIALAAINRIRAEVPDAVVGAGTVLDPRHYRQAVEAGASFVVSPGFTERLLHAAGDHHVPYMPGASTASEAMQLAERGCHVLKFFPAESVGGTSCLASLAGPLPHIRFCATGGITPALAPRYLALPNVVCVGGSWMLSPDLIETGNWAAIRQHAVTAVALGRAEECSV